MAPTTLSAHQMQHAGGLAGAMARAGGPSADYMIGRAGGLLLDGLGSHFSADETDANLHMALLVRDTGAPGTDAWPLPPGLPVAGAKNGWANGHFANHPPPGTPATVVAWPYDFPPSLPPRLLPFLPNCYAARRVGDEPRISRHSLVLVAATTLRDGDECFLDYSLDHAASLAAERPPWLSEPPLRGDTLVAFQDSDQAGCASGQDQPPSPLETVKGALGEWRARFEEENGRTATRADLFGDPVAAALFEEFQRLNILEWDE